MLTSPLEVEERESESEPAVRAAAEVAAAMEHGVRRRVGSCSDLKEGEDEEVEERMKEEEDEETSFPSFSWRQKAQIPPGEELFR